MCEQTLFSPCMLFGLPVKNVIAMPALHMGAAVGGKPQEHEIEFYRQRAAGGAGVITVGVCNTYDSPSADMKGALALCMDDQIPAMGKLAAAIKSEGSIAGVQLSPLCGYNVPSFVPPVGAMDEIVKSVGTAAQRALSAGFDFVELLLSGGGFFSHLLSPVHNPKIEGYSGSFANRLKGPIQALAAIQTATGGKLPIAVRLHCHEFLDGGYGVEEAVLIAQKLEAAGVGAINITGGGHKTALPQLTSQVPPGAFAHLARQISTSVSVPTFYGGRIRTPDEAITSLIRSGATFINLGRPLIADPLWPQKAKAGEASQIVPCMACGGCFDLAFSKKEVRCSINPLVGNAKKSNQRSSSGDAVDLTQRALVVGAGIAGLQAAWTLAQLGNTVEVFEREAYIGGGFHNIGRRLTGREDLKETLSAFIHRLEIAGVQIKTGICVTPEMVKSKKYDLVVVATGAKAYVPDIPGLSEHPRVFHSEDVLKGRAPVGGDIAIVGGNGAGVELAIHFASLGLPSKEAIGFFAQSDQKQWLDEALAFDPGSKVTLFKRRGFLGKGLGRSIRWTMIQDVQRLGVTVVDRIDYEKITSKGLQYFDRREKKSKFCPADTIILATGYQVDEAVVRQFEKSAPKVVFVGDVDKVGNLGAAVHAAHHKLISAFF